MLEYRYFLEKNAHFYEKHKIGKKKGQNTNFEEHVWKSIFSYIFIIYLKIGNFDFLGFPFIRQSKLNPYR